MYVIFKISYSNLHIYTSTTIHLEKLKYIMKLASNRFERYLVSLWELRCIFMCKYNGERVHSIDDQRECVEFISSLKMSLTLEDKLPFNTPCNLFSFIFHLWTNHFAHFPDYQIYVARLYLKSADHFFRIFIITILRSLRDRYIYFSYLIFMSNALNCELRLMQFK